MGEKAAEMGVDIITGTPGSDIIYGERGEVNGIITKDFGISKKGEPK
jgi:electron-transferring-flavoprotein dehydrogenase